MLQSASIFTLHEIQRMLQYRFMNLLKTTVQRQDIMVPGSSLQSCLWKEKVRFKYQPAHARNKPPPYIVLLLFHV